MSDLPQALLPITLLHVTGRTAGAPQGKIRCGKLCWQRAEHVWLAAAIRFTLSTHITSVQVLPPSLLLQLFLTNCSQVCIAFMSKTAWQQQPGWFNPAAKPKAYGISPVVCSGIFVLHARTDKILQHGDDISMFT